MTNDSLLIAQRTLPSLYQTVVVLLYQLIYKLQTKKMPASKKVCRKYKLEFIAGFYASTLHSNLTLSVRHVFETSCLQGGQFSLIRARSVLLR